MRAVDAPARAFTSPTRACARRRDRARGRVAPKRSLKVTAVDVDARATIATMYDRINARDVAGALECVAEDVVYEDFNFPEPFVGKAAVGALFEESCSGIPDDLAFVVD